MNTIKARVQLTRGDTLPNDLYTGKEGELTLDTEAGTLRVHDGEVSGGSGQIPIESLQHESFPYRFIGGELDLLDVGSLDITFPNNDNFFCDRVDVITMECEGISTEASLVLKSENGDVLHTFTMNTTESGERMSLPIGPSTLSLRPHKTLTLEIVSPANGDTYRIKALFLSFVLR